MTRPNRPGQLALVLVAAALCLAPTIAHADEPSDEAGEHLVLFNEGRALVHAERYAEALESFQRSLALHVGSGTLLNIGDCQEKLGRYASAVAAFERAEAIAREKKQLERANEATDRLVRVRPLMSKLTVVSSITNARAEVDGAPVQIGRATPIDGGSHVVRVQAPCRVAQELRVSVELKNHALSVPVDDLAMDPACRPAAADKTASGHGQRLLAIVLGSAGVVAAGVGAGFGLSALGTKDDLRAACPTYPTGCAPSGRTEVDGLYEDARSAATISTIAFSGAAVLLGSAAALYLAAPSVGAKQTSKSIIAPLAWAF